MYENNEIVNVRFVLKYAQMKINSECKELYDFDRIYGVGVCADGDHDWLERWKLGLPIYLSKGCEELCRSETKWRLLTMVHSEIVFNAC